MSTAVAAPSRLRALVSGKGLFAVTVWGASFVATRIALEWLNAWSLVAIRLWAGALLLALLASARGVWPWPERRDRAMCVFLGATLAAHLTLQAYGLNFTSAQHTGWIIGFIPVTVAIGAHLLAQQRLTPGGWLGVALGAAGIGVVIAPGARSAPQAVDGDLLQLASCLTWTVYTLAAAVPLARSGALRSTTTAMAVAAALTTCVAVPAGLAQGPFSWRALAALMFLGPICSGAAYVLWFAAVREHGPARVSSYIYLEPFVTAVLALTLLREPFTLWGLVGGLVVLWGVWLVAHGTRGAPAAALAPD